MSRRHWEVKMAALVPPPCRQRMRGMDDARAEVSVMVRFAWGCTCHTSGVLSGL